MSSPGSALVELRDLTKVYGSGEGEVRALDGLDLIIRRGELVAIMGPSGSGKSTAMNIMGYLDTPSSGTYLFDGVPVQAVTRAQRTLLRRSFLGFVFQGYNLLSRSNALENVELPLTYRGVGRRMRRDLARKALERVGLQGREHHFPSQLSGGQQQRVAIARAIVTSPMLLLADEPTGNLDTATSRDIMNLLVDLNRSDGITVAMVTHEPDMAAFCQRQIRIVDGQAQDDARENAHVD
ncbi:ABC transporter ATP-binding protein [Devosia salina]|uniref:ABC transporter ATP-binding protein n=1 Tax=Devosia salina TaxID=2860336 RepID=A0ABX8WD82_9HYPH|nr:ABC transporter ATP-binding protein [Devosia salina]QYO76039.1 ABC transporter ATP-binding protein [Devosia salina]